MSAIDDLPPLREVIREHSLSARKSLGQNFLLDLNLTARIARAAGPLEDATVIEVGPGPGGLTRALLALGARRVIAVERDERALAPLEAIAKRYPRRLEIVCADAQTFDPRPDARRRAREDRRQPALQYRDAIIGRLASIEPWPPWYDMMVLMFSARSPNASSRRKMTRPMAASRCSPTGAPRQKSCSTSRRRHSCRSRKSPSSVVRLVPRQAPLPCDRRALEQVAAAAFGQRRKMLRQSLKSLSVDPARLPRLPQVDATARARPFRCPALLPWRVN
jgi:16S rRNA (adenine1518-N6/adenine1519-N6)-dimethyltransferase